jgi:hypothetical protein
MSNSQLRLLVYLMAFGIGTARAQQNVPPPPKPADSGPSLADTMNFIQDKLNDLKVTYMSYGHDNVAGTDFTNKFTDEYTKVVADPGACQIRYHYKDLRDGGVTVDTDPWFNLKAVANIVVMSREQALKQIDSAAGHPEYSYKIDPPMFVLHVVRTDKALHDFTFPEEDLANRVAKAMVHAVELCGGGSKPEPF